MIHLQRSIVIARERSEVFSLISNPDRYPEFFVGITEWSPRSKKRRGRGARFRVLMQVGSIEAGGVLRVTYWQEPSAIKWESEQGIRQTGRWHLTDHNDGTELSLEIDFDLSGGPVGFIVERLAGRIITRNMWATLLGARRLLESENNGDVIDYFAVDARLGDPGDVQDVVDSNAEPPD